MKPGRFKLATHEELQKLSIKLMEDNDRLISCMDVMTEKILHPQIALKTDGGIILETELKKLREIERVCKCGTLKQRIRLFFRGEL